MHLWMFPVEEWGKMKEKQAQWAKDQQMERKKWEAEVETERQALLKAWQRHKDKKLAWDTQCALGRKRVDKEATQVAAAQKALQAERAQLTLESAQLQQERGDLRQQKMHVRAELNGLRQQKMQTMSILPEMEKAAAALQAQKQELEQKKAQQLQELKTLEVGELTYHITITSHDRQAGTHAPYIPTTNY